MIVFPPLSANFGLQYLEIMGNVSIVL